MSIGSFGAIRIPNLLLAILPPLMSNDYVEYTLAIRNDEPLIQINKHSRLPKNTLRS